MKTLKTSIMLSFATLALALTSTAALATDHPSAFRGMFRPGGEVSRVSEIDRCGRIHIWATGSASELFTLRVYNSRGEMVDCDLDRSGGCELSFNCTAEGAYRIVLTNESLRMSNYQLFID